MEPDYQRVFDFFSIQLSDTEEYRWNGLESNFGQRFLLLAVQRRNASF